MRTPIFRRPLSRRLLTSALGALMVVFSATESAMGQTDPVYDRPFVTSAGSGSTAIGGYLEGNTNYFSEDGVSEGFSMELRRFNIFLYSKMGTRVSFISELEFEHGTEEIALETALIDFRLSPELSLRAGILLPPIGLFNQNHDSPKWEFIDRPLASTEIIPSTLSEVGFGLHGHADVSGINAAYQVYLVNGLGAGIVNNSQGRTHIPSGKSEETFEEDNNGKPSITARLELSTPDLGKVGLSWYGGVYNNWQIEGEAVAEKRAVRLLAVDFRTEQASVTIQGEAVVAWVDVPDDLGEFFGDEQIGAFLDVSIPVHTGSIGSLEGVTVAGALRAEYVDYNRGTFGSGSKIHDDVRALVLGLSLRPNSETIFKLNYRHHWIRDLLGNPARLGGFQVGFASYF
ncbi:MAG: hypothetical protein ACI80V_002598 [Rhodothermales bacterium]|jgi:hypothetical protein